MAVQTLYLVASAGVVGGLTGLSDAAAIEPRPSRPSQPLKATTLRLNSYDLEYP